MMTNEDSKLHAKYLPPGYRKHSVFVTHVAPGSKQSVSSYWAGGSRDYYTLIRNGVDTIIDTAVNPVSDKELKYLTLQAGDVLIRSGIFMGKKSTAYIIYCDINN